MKILQTIRRKAFLRVAKLLAPNPYPDRFLPTHGAHHFKYDDPNPDHVLIEDIAVSLSRQARFNGHTKFPYWVAVHVVDVSYLVPQEIALEALLHDASETYMGDVISPLKGYFRSIWEDIEGRVDRVIIEAINTREQFPAGREIKALMNPWIAAADLTALKTEALALCTDDVSEWKHIRNVPASNYIIREMSCEEARALFMARYEELVSIRKRI